MQITGTTQLIAHLGYPTATFTSPMIYNPLFRARGIDAVVVPMGCKARHYEAVLASVTRLTNFIGALVTMPHKVTTAHLVDELDAAAQVCGACNAVMRSADGRLLGAMFDGEGFVRGLARKGHSVAGRSACITGCGGVGAAIAASLATAGLARLSLYDIDAAAAGRLADRLSAHFPALSLSAQSLDVAAADIVVNATPLGMKDGDPLPIAPDEIMPAAIVGDVVLGRRVTPFLAAAKARGAETLAGTDMLFEQIPAYFEFFGLPATTPEELRAHAELATG
jgi:shikimate dehydrogenase